jgi:tetratricopeptide (TPR) repeat protein
MSPVSPDMLARFARLPRNSAEVWQGGMARIPAWVEKGPDGKPYRPWGAFWVSLRTGLVHEKSEPEGGLPGPAVVLEALLEFGLKRELAGCRPSRIEVADEPLATYLRGVLTNAGVAVSLAKDLSAVQEVLAHLAQHMSGKPLPPNALDGSGVTVERMRAFADAARDFYRAAPWRYLSDEDLVHVESPVLTGLRHLSVLGGAGHTFGLGFYEKPEDFERLFDARDPEEYFDQQGKWAVLYGPIMDLSYGDADLWEAHGLSVAGDDAYPVAVWFGPGAEVRRPDARTLTDLEALLLALAATGEDEIDQGRWTKAVQTIDGQRTVTLCLPELLEPLDASPRARPGRIPDRRATERTMAEMERFMAESNLQNVEEANAAIQERFVGRPMDTIPSTAATPLEKAQELMYRAFDARGRRRIQLTRKALEISPDCADAYVLLAEEAVTPEASLDLYQQGIAAGERAMGPDVMRDEVGHFWGIVSTRPYMRAKMGLAHCLEEMERTDEAIGHYQDLLRLNPNDNQGVRVILLPLLLATGRDAEAGALLGQYADDASATWKYGWALWTFRRGGDSPAAQDRLREAIKTNRHVPKYLIGKAEKPEMLPDSYAFGSPEEAVLCAEDLADAWQATPGADRWLLTFAPKRKTGAPKRRRRSG